jgi:ATP-binding protein involved in chromosome partitioning
MTTESSAGASDRESAVRTALRADIVASDLYSGLSSLGGVGEITVSDEEVAIAVTLPVPSEPVRRRIERELIDAATTVDGVESVDITWDPAAEGAGARLDLIPDVKHVVAVVSGKGGVGKSTVAVNVAAALADAGANVGLLDADVYGPNAPTMLGLSDSSPRTTRYDEMQPREGRGVKTMSMDFVVDEDDPVIWRGPVVDDVLKQFFDDVAWGSLDYLVVDMPPGTGDAHLSLVQHLPVTGAVVVTTPTSVATDDAKRGLRMFARYDVPVLGVVENMTTFECPDCGHDHDVFGSSGASDVAERFDVPVLGRLPLDPAVQSRTEREEDDGGLSIPYIGTLSLPRTLEEREQSGRRPPVVLRDDVGELRDEARLVSTRIAARVNAYATR